MKDIIKKLSKQRSEGQFSNVSLFDTQQTEFQDLGAVSKQLLPDLFNGNQKLKDVVEAYYEEGNEREFNLIFRGLVLSCKNEAELKELLNDIAIIVASEEVLNKKIKHFVQKAVPSAVDKISDFVTFV